VLGAAVHTAGLTWSDPRYRQTLLSSFGSITSEWEMKMDSIEPWQGWFDFSKGDQLAAFAAANGLKMRGHTLLWHQQLPAWMSQGWWTRATLEPVLKQYVQTVVAHFRGKVDSWDVVNEPLNDDGTMRDNLWYRVIGPDYISLALTWARQADPNVKLFINDYGAEWPNAKRDALLRLVTDLRSRGVPLDGVGFQAHFTTSWYPTRAQLQDTLQQFANLGLRVEITELDVATQSATDPAELVKQGQIYGDVGAACRAVVACDRITTWGITDASSWLGSAKRPLPFDVNYAPKPAYTALAAAVKQPR
jgi:endo-1,4-beta-xylanase